MRASCELERVRVPRRGIIASIFALTLHGAMPVGWMIVVLHAILAFIVQRINPVKVMMVLGENNAAVTNRTTGWMQILSIACV